MHFKSRLSEVRSLVCPVVGVFLPDWKPWVNQVWLLVGNNGNQRLFSCLLSRKWSKGLRLCFWDFRVCNCRLSAVITNSAAQPRRTTAASAAATAHPADWCEDTINPSTVQEKVNNLGLFFLWGISTPPNILVADFGTAYEQVYCSIHIKTSWNDTFYCFSSFIPPLAAVCFSFCCRSLMGS